MKLNCELQTKMSKTGKPYNVVVIQIGPDCTKEVFLEKAELSLIKLTYGSVKQENK